MGFKRLPNATFGLSIIHVSYGSKHDFQLFKENACEFSEQLRILADAGYQGLTELHENSQTPFKKSKYHALTKREKQSNRSLARKRIVIEHISVS